MRIVGIIAEYNPFHQGHAYQIKKVRELTQADFILVSMSGNFVQRGAPAMFDKYTRAHAALFYDMYKYGRGELCSPAIIVFYQRANTVRPYGCGAIIIYQLHKYSSK